jgi:hypothetical protein
MQKIMARQVIWFFQYIKNQHRLFDKQAGGVGKEYPITEDQILMPTTQQKMQ